MSASKLWLIGHTLFHLIFVVRVLARNLSVPVTLGWVVVLVFIPYAGPMAYLMIGENRLGRKRAERAKALSAQVSPQNELLEKTFPVDWSTLNPSTRHIHRIAHVIRGAPATSGNKLLLYHDSAVALGALISDVERAKKECVLSFYIWSDGGLIDDLAEALIRAQKRGVVCRVLLDYVGSRSFFRGPRVQQFQQAGIEVQACLRVAFWRILLQRMDLRNHRKLAVIDGKIGFTGSLNLADPKFFKKDQGVGQWIDILARIEGPTVQALHTQFYRDWEMETGSGNLGKDMPIESIASYPENVAVQLLPSGPDVQFNAIHEILLTLIYQTRNELIITSPYFVPTENILTALCTIALSGCQVTLIIPEKVDSRMAQYACQSTFESLAWAGVSIQRYKGGLLHAKAVTVDGQVALLGSLNMDRRSFFINFELSLLVCDADVVTRLRDIQNTYLKDCELLDLARWKKRSRGIRGMEKVIRLTSPLL